MRVFIGGSKGLVLYEDGEISHLSDEKILCLDRPTSDLALAGTEQGHILAWEGNGDARIIAKDVGDAVHSLRSVNKRVYAGTSPAATWASKDLGHTWAEVPAFSQIAGASEWWAPFGTPLTSSIAAHQKDPRTVYVGVEVGGIFRTRNSGGKWFDVEIPGADVHAIEISPAKSERIYVTTGEGAYVSDDAGFMWRPMGESNPRQYTMGLAAHPTEADRVVISAAAGSPGTWSGKKGARCCVYLSTDSGGRFRTVAKDLKGAVRRQALIINLKVPSEVVFGTTTGDIFYSNDGGETFGQMADGLGDIKAITFA